MASQFPLPSVALAVAAAALVLSAGCDNKTKDVSEVGPKARQAISEAAVAKYPGNPTVSRDMQLTAINYPEKKYLEIHNPGTTSVPPSTVWVNGSFMTKIDGIAPKSFAKVEHGQLLEAGPATNDLKTLNQPVAKVEIQTDRGLFSVQGPTIKRD
jgi:hypothetical protein